MAYTTTNYKSKKLLKEAVARGEKVTVFQPGLGTVPINGSISLEGPHYPEPHRWYATAVLKDSVVVKVS